MVLLNTPSIASVLTPLMYKCTKEYMYTYIANNLPLICIHQSINWVWGSVAKSILVSVWMNDYCNQCNHLIALSNAKALYHSMSVLPLAFWLAKLAYGGWNTYSNSQRWSLLLRATSGWECHMSVTWIMRAITTLTVPGRSHPWPWTLYAEAYLSFLSLILGFNSGWGRCVFWVLEKKKKSLIEYLGGKKFVESWKHQAKTAAT